MKNWILKVTRETLLLERYYRVIGYRDLFKDFSNIKVKNILVQGERGLVKLYMVDEELSARRKKIVDDIKKIKIKKFNTFFEKVIGNLQKALVETNNQKNWKSFSQFTKYYQLARAIVLYADDLAEGVKNTNLRKYTKIIEKWHEVSEVTTCNSWDNLKPFFLDISKKHKIKFNDLMFYLPQEFRLLLLANKKNKQSEINQRKKLFLIYLKEGKIFFHSGKKAVKIIKTELKSERSNNKNLIIKGSAAFQGKVKGIVKIINSSKEMKKMKEGEIIVSVMTAPRLYPVIKKAKGIITNEGGIVCHAAVISREFKIPCIVGTKNATKILKDGDKVLLDAFKGIVKIIK